MHTESVQLLAGTPAPAREYDADIIILALDRPQETLAAIASACGQRGISRQVIVLDQGSARVCVELFKAAVGAARGAALYGASHNLGVGGGRNMLASLGAGRVIVGLDNDATFLSDHMAAQAVAAFDRDDRLGALGFRVARPDGVRVDRAAWGYPESLLVAAWSAFETTTFVGAGHALRRSAFEAAQGYDPTLFFTWEEYELSLRLIASGWRIVYDGHIAVRHAASELARMHWDGARLSLFIRNRILIGRRWNQSWPALAPRIAGYLVRAARAGRARAAFEGIAAAVRLDRTQPHHPMPAAMREYIHDHETIYRRAFLASVVRELARRDGGGWARRPVRPDAASSRPAA
jgi:GT2 family glycosyltransferase